MISPKKAGVRRVLLFSDLHIGQFPGHLRDLCGKRWLGVWNQLLFRRRHLRYDRLLMLAKMLPEIDPDLVLCGGDLTSVSLPEEFRVTECFLYPILHWCGAERFCYLPGNHDTYIRERRARAALEETFDHLNNGRWTLDQLPTVYSIEGLDLALLDAARPTHPFHSCGIIDEGMAHRFTQKVLPRMTQRNSAVLCHFPAFDREGKLSVGTHGLRGAQVLADSLQTGKAQAILSGHEHHAYLYHLPSSSPSLPGGTQVCAGSLTLYGTFSVIDFGDTVEARILHCPV